MEELQRHGGPAGAPRSKRGKPLIGTCYLHTVIDDHSRVAYVGARDDETEETATEVLRNAVAWFADRGVTVESALTDTSVHQVRRDTPLGPEGLIMLSGGYRMECRNGPCAPRNAALREAG